LIGAIEAREQEKKQTRENVSGHMVQAAIAQRQHHAKAQQVQAQKDAQRMSAQFPAAYAQQYPQQQGGYYAQQYPQQQQQQWTSWGAPVDGQAQAQAQAQYQQQQWQTQQQHSAQQAAQQQWRMSYQSQQPPPSGYDQSKYGGYYQ
jgi:hypothetical protein